MSVRTETQRQFWRESEQAWVDHVSIRSDELPAQAQSPRRWRHRVVTIVTDVGEWQPTKDPAARTVTPVRSASSAPDQP